MSLSESSENACVVCFKSVLIYSVGDCKCQNNPVCFNCITRLRVLCRQHECPICRTDLPKVIFTSKATPFRTINTSSYLLDKKFKIYFENLDIQSAFYKLLEHACSVCPNHPVFRTFHNLKDHVRREHELHYCDLCVDNLMIFTEERRAYTRQELGMHRRVGDSDNRSHRGHPLCEFCSERYMDNDELYRHLRRDHLFCHFCDVDGLHQYYPSYDDLRQHFRNEHYLCEEGDCIEEKFTPVFRSDIDLKAHRASAHGRTLGKVATKQARTLELEFTLAPRPETIRRPRNMRQQHEEEQIAPTDVNVPHMDEFPTLSGIPAAPTTTNRNSRTNGVTIRTHGKPPAVTDANFPALGLEATGSGCKTVRLSVNSGQRDKPPANVSIHVNHRSNPRVQPSTSREDFPSLSKAKPSVGPTTAQWTQPKPKPQQVKPPTTFTVQEAFPGLNSRKTFQTNDLASKFSSSCSVASSSSKPMASSSSKPMTSSTSWSEASKVKEVAEASAVAKVKKKKAKETKPVVKETNEAVGKKKKKEILEPDPPQKSKKKNAESGKVPIVEKPVIETPAAQPSSLNNGTERKRSELTVASLDRSNQHISPPPLKEFPPLAGKVPMPPPGFGASIKAPPPGFSVTLNSVARPQSNGLTFTSSSGQSYSILPRVFVQPHDFNTRNQLLIAKVASCLKDNDISEFRQLSTMFRQGTLPAQSFYTLCEEAMGSGFKEILPEMLVLLPDIDKQQDLLAVCVRNLAKIEVCPTCRQVLSTSDSRHHASSHSLENHFPALANSEPVAPSAWGKSKQ